MVSQPRFGQRGLDEPPRQHQDTPGYLDANVVVALEARLAREGSGGVNITDPVAITGSGAERLSAVPINTWE